jgi:hypothetical protein
LTKTTGAPSHPSEPPHLEHPLQEYKHPAGYEHASKNKPQYYMVRNTIENSLISRTIIQPLHFNYGRKKFSWGLSSEMG